MDWKTKGILFVAIYRDERLIPQVKRNREQTLNERIPNQTHPYVYRYLD